MMEIFKMLKVEKSWHPPKIRFGADTIKTFKEKSNPDLVLQEEDIYFVDIGPVVDHHEGDYGMTFTVGANPQLALLQRASREIFDLGKKMWKEGMSGEALYRELEQQAKMRGLVLDDRMKGHRIGDFPHHVNWRGGLDGCDRVPAENKWVLEIHLIDETLKRGSFFEDIL